ncbi:MAG TPA: PEP-CTERM sorting domain-containing protein [Fimbriimonadaceae bacterium]|nr:PEP-CTERM sorting domain-containing protein [Fimbriimonadaceae bacterium]
MKFLAVASVLAASLSAHAIVIDSFMAGPYDSGSITSVGPLFTATQNGPTTDIIGGIREVKQQLFANPLGTNGGARMTVGSGVMAVSQAPMTDGQYALFYGNPGNFLNKDMSAETAFQFDLLFNDLAPLRLNLRVGTNGFGSSNAIVNLPVVTSGPQTVVVPFAAFTGAAQWNDIDSVRFFFDTETSGDFAIGQISTVPEPTAFAALAIGGYVLLRRRRR